jgi:hypothetical protein
LAHWNWAIAARARARDIIRRRTTSGCDRDVLARRFAKVHC